jgi:hypothetical protein
VLHVILSIVEEDFENVTCEAIYVGPRCNRPKLTFNPHDDVEKRKMLLVRPKNEDGGKIVWMEMDTSNIF